MGRRSLLVVVCVALGAVPLIAAGPGDAGDPVAAGVPMMDLTLGDDAVAGLPGVLPEGVLVVRVTNTAASRCRRCWRHTARPGWRTSACGASASEAGS